MRWWLAAGVILGLGLANKHSVGFFGVALLAGALLTGREGRRLVLNWWFAAGAGIAAVFAVPDLWWQAQHQWATISMTQSLNQENGGVANIGNWVIGQVLMTAVAMVGVWLAGLRFLWRSQRPLWRALAWAYGLLFVLFMLTTGGKIYYLAGAYVYLLAAGAVVIDERLAARGRSLRRLLTATAISCAAALPLVLPVLPAADIGWTAKVNSVAAESVGWPQLVSTVRTVWTSLPASRARPRGDLHGRLRRSRRDQRAGPRQRPAAGGERTQQRTGGGDRGTRPRRRSWRWRRGRWTPPGTPATCASSSAASGSRRR